MLRRLHNQTLFCCISVESVLRGYRGQPVLGEAMEKELFSKQSRTFTCISYVYVCIALVILRRLQYQTLSCCISFEDKDRLRHIKRRLADRLETVI